MRFRFMLVAGFASTLCLMAVLPAGATTKAQLRSKLLSLSDFPTGWTVDNSSSGGGGVVNGGCLAGVKQAPSPRPRSAPRSRMVSCRSSKRSSSRGMAPRRRTTGSTMCSPDASTSRLWPLVHPLRVDQALDVVVGPLSAGGVLDADVTILSRWPR